MYYLIQDNSELNAYYFINNYSIIPRLIQNCHLAELLPK